MSLKPGQKQTFQMEVTVRHPADCAEAVSGFFFERGARAVIQDDEDSQILSRCAFENEAQERRITEELPEFLKRLALIFGLETPPGYQWQKIDNLDWTEKWKEGLKPVTAGKGLVIKPSWCDYQAKSGQVVLELDPGMAFGTGHHESTFLCLEEIEAFFSRKKKNIKVLDVGTGSGILTMAALALGAQSALAVDPDLEALVVAEQNLKSNGLAHKASLVCCGPEAVNGAFDLVLANINHNVLLRLAPEFARLTGTEGRLVVSGILLDQVKSIKDAFLSQGLAVAHKRSANEWAALIFENKGG